MASQILKRKLKSMAAIATGGGLVFCTIGFYKGDEKLYKNVLMPLVHRLTDPETAHRLAIFSAKYGLFRQASITDSEILNTTLWGVQFNNPIGLAAGFDKHGEAVHGLHKMGFGFIEVGSVTPQPQPGNPRPRIFRLVEDKAVINRYGFNSDGQEVVQHRLKSVYPFTDGILGINLGKNKMSSNANEDYIKGVENFASLADFLVINISSPNTPGLRSMQTKQALQELLQGVLQAKEKLQKTKVPILIKIAPDLNYEECKDIANEILTQKIDGIVISNTTTSRPASLKSSFKDEAGGLSGSPLRELSTETIKNMYILTKGKVPIIGVGGISSGKDAYEKIRAGASLIELYTALVYEGPPVIAKIKRELIELLKKDGFSTIAEAVGAEHKIK